MYRAGYPTDNFEPIEGMTLRDYFADEAMQAMIPLMEQPLNDWHDFKSLSKAAYNQADAMLEARKKGV